MKTIYYLFFVVVFFVSCDRRHQAQTDNYDDKNNVTVPAAKPAVRPAAVIPWADPALAAKAGDC